MQMMLVSCTQQRNETIMQTCLIIKIMIFLQMVMNNEISWIVNNNMAPYNLLMQLEIAAKGHTETCNKNMAKAL